MSYDLPVIYRRSIEIITFGAECELFRIEIGKIKREKRLERKRV